jgi:hypothetical protein
LITSSLVLKSIRVSVASFMKSNFWLQVII